MFRIRLIHWNSKIASQRISELESLGYQVDFTPINPTELRQIRQHPPDIIVIDLTRSPSQGRDLGLNFRIFKDTRFVPLVFAGGDPDKVMPLKDLLPDATFTGWENIGLEIEKVLQAPPADPIVPSSVFAAYAGTPLPKKLGIKPGSRVILINAPEFFHETLGSLPEGAVLTKGFQKGDVHLWFTTAQSDLEANIQKMAILAEAGPLWIIWTKKSSKLAGDLTQNIVRQTGLKNGLVDYKVCSVDEDWSGLCFTSRKV